MTDRLPRDLRTLYTASDMADAEFATTKWIRAHTGVEWCSECLRPWSPLAAGRECACQPCAEPDCWRWVVAGETWCEDHGPACVHCGDACEDDDREDDGQLCCRPCAEYLAETEPDEPDDESCRCVPPFCSACGGSGRRDARHGSCSCDCDSNRCAPDALEMIE